MIRRIKAGENLKILPNPPLTKEGIFSFELEANSSLELTQVIFASEDYRQDYEIRFLGEHAFVNLNLLDLANKDSKLETNIKIYHEVSNCVSKQLHKGLYSESAQGFLKANILMSKGAVNSDASQLHRSLLLSKDARSYAEPFLDIQVDEVKCQHGVSIGQLDEKALFYMQARGLDLKSAEKILVQAFAREILEKIEDLELRERLSRQVYDWI